MSESVSDSQHFATDCPMAAYIDPGECCDDPDMCRDTAERYRIHDQRFHEYDPRAFFCATCMGAAAKEASGASCPRGEECALNDGALRCKHCGRNWPPDDTWAAAAKLSVRRPV